ncbi:WD40-repeat-containing domain protein [Lasiosphaeria hispida]|uniref:WD40-repeat-containing domain protein n=1 Tax=Lasiosphaeria hispida TaxID=260671 RepID=A0AAJ0ME48_9PEZI|nr:WD40-repeat-containing domain protein [Lasiosphaeria hispida]
MRPRRAATRGVKKRYTEDPLAFVDGEDDPVAIPDDQSADGDFDAQAEVVQDEDDDIDDGDASSDDGAGQQPAAEAGKASAAQPRRHRNAGAGMIQSRRGYHDIPQYPLETRIVTRVYAGPLRRYARYSALRDSMYGPEYQRIKIIWDLENRWTDFPLLPPKLPPDDPQGIAPSPWVPAGFELSQERSAYHWYDEYQISCPEVQRSHIVSSKHLQQLLSRAEGGGLATLIGPWEGQQQLTLNSGEGFALTTSGVPPTESSNEKMNGWMFDVGGIPLAVAWAPLSRRSSQVLAVASIPFADQELEGSREKSVTGVPDTTGCIQFWEFTSDGREEGMATPSRSPPKLLATKFFDWGRPKRLQWCPVPLDSTGIYGVLAVLSGDGRARIVEVRNIDPNNTHYEWVESSTVNLSTANDYNVNVTCLTWTSTNRIALGHSDGSITLWSVYPVKMLQRVNVHSTYVIDICSGYPSSPYLVASIPVGGCATLTDLSQPSSETTYFPVPAITFQPNMLCWSESMQGFMALYPSSTPTTTVAFLHHRFFCQARSTITGPNSVTCISAGSSHPFILVGSADGSVYSCNALQKLFRQKGDPLKKIKIFEHEYRPIDNPATQPNGTSTAQLRGAVRVLHGFLPEINDDPRTEKRKEIDRKKRLERKKQQVGKRKGRGKKNDGPDVDLDDREAEIDDRLASRVVTHEPLTRITAVAWNPNQRFSCWAACAMGSGLIKIMDLGVE